MKIALGADHAAFDLKSRVAGLLRELGHEPVDVGCHSTESCDYPDYAYAAAKAVSDGRCERAVLMCGSGIGMEIVANKVAGVRAALVHDLEAAELSRRHNDANALCLGARVTNAERAAEIVKKWLTTPFEGGRHERRVQKIREIDERERCRDRQ